MKLEKNLNKIRLIIFLACLFVSFVFSYFLFIDLYNKAADKELRGNLGYVSDEIYYASTARNILKDFFGINTFYIDEEGYVYYTIIFLNEKSRDEQLNFINKELKKINGSIHYVYSQFPGLAIKIPKDKAFKITLQNVTKFVSGYPYPNVKFIPYYYNLEHPPLAKYIIGLSLLINGDNPVSWRLPSIIFTSALPIIIFLVVSRLTDPIAGVFASLIPFFDKLIFNMGFLALLDVHLAFFIILSLLFAVHNKHILSAITIGLAAAIKLTGVFLIFPLYILLRIKKNNLRISLIIAFLIPLLTWIIVNIPLITKLGFQTWLNNLIGALRWHTTSRPEGPPTSLPWEWFINSNPFYFHFNPTYSAIVTSEIYLLGILFIIFTAYLAVYKNINISSPSLWFLGIFFGFILIIILGNRTLYSFYVFTLAPIVYVILITNIYSMFLFDRLSIFFQKKNKLAIKYLGKNEK